MALSRTGVSVCHSIPRIIRDIATPFRVERPSLVVLVSHPAGNTNPPSGGRRVMVPIGTTSPVASATSVHARSRGRIGSSGRGVFATVRIVGV